MDDNNNNNISRQVLSLDSSNFASTLKPCKRSNKDLTLNENPQSY